MSKYKEVIAMQLLTDYKGKTFSDSDEAIMYITGMLVKAWESGYKTKSESVKKNTPKPFRRT